MTYVAPSIKVIENAIDFSNDIIFLARQHEDRWSKSAVGDNYEFKEAVRTSSELGLPFGLDYPKEFFLLAQTIYLHARQYAMENGVEFSHMENLNMLRYKAGEGFYDRHVDSGPAFPRAMSALLYLNDVQEGGGTWFDKFNLMIKPEVGKLVLFPATYAYSHQAMAPVSNDKYVVVTWFGMILNEGVFENYYANHGR